MGGGRGDRGAEGRDSLREGLPHSWQREDAHEEKKLPS